MAKRKSKFTKKRWATMVLVLTAGAASVVFAETPLSIWRGVDPGIAPYTSPATELSGRLSVVGSETMKPLLIKLASSFSRFHPDINMAIEGGGSGKAIRKFLIGFTSQRRGEKARDGHNGSALASMLASSRELTPDELKTFRSRYGYDPMVMSIALDAVAIFVHRQNPIEGLTLEQIDAVFSTTHKRGLAQDIGTWDQLGLQNDWAQRPIHLHGRDDNSGTRGFFDQVALLGGQPKTEVLESPGSASELLAIARDPWAMGYAGIEYQSSFVRSVPVAEKANMPYVEPTADAVRDKTYPLSRSLYLYINADPQEKLNPLIIEFLRFVNSQEGQDTVAKAQYYPLTAHQVAANLEKINGAILTASLIK